ncbi:MAG TPA: hypothetical protein VI297_02565 [Gemmatimonadales bacterium]
MDDVRPASLNTREFAVRWTTILEEHFAARLAETLGLLVPASPNEPLLKPEQRAVLARHIVRALHVAATSPGGVQEAVHFLAQVAAEGEAGRRNE